MKHFLTILLLGIVLASCHHFKEPELKGIENVSIGKLGWGESTIRMQIKYFNPNHFNATLKQAEGEAWMDSSYLGHFKVDTLVHVPANSDFIIPVKLVVDMKYLLQHSLSALANSEVNIKVTGTARAGRNGFYKTFPVRYEGKQDLAKLFKEGALPE
jgi:LEA14-like dessication related protein